jgi:hypothetical protein
MFTDRTVNPIECDAFFFFRAPASIANNPNQIITQLCALPRLESVHISCVPLNDDRWTAICTMSLLRHLHIGAEESGTLSWKVLSIDIIVVFARACVALQQLVIREAVHDYEAYCFQLNCRQMRRNPSLASPTCAPSRTARKCLFRST